MAVMEEEELMAAAVEMAAVVEMAVVLVVGMRMEEVPIVQVGVPTGGHMMVTLAASHRDSSLAQRPQASGHIAETRPLHFCTVVFASCICES